MKNLFKIKLTLVIAISAMLTLISCSEHIEVSPNADNHFHLKIDDAYLPLLVRGNTESETILLYIQGGPGLSTIDAATIDFFEWQNTLEKDVAIAYYDQRGVGNKQGVFDIEQITMEQYIKDLDIIVDLLRQNYPSAKIILFGHSFGGHLAYRYLIKNQNTDKINGLISIAGPVTHDGENVSKERWQFRHAYLSRVADRFIEMGINEEVFKEAKEWASSLDEISTDEERSKWNEYVSNGFEGLDGKVKFSDYLNGIFTSSLNVFATLNYSLDEIVADKLQEDENKTNILPYLPSIEVPSLLLAGEFDDITPVEELIYTQEQIGNETNEVVIFENAGHDLFFDKPKKFHQVVVDFCKDL